MKRIIIGMIVLLSGSVIYAQDLRDKFTFGLRAGMNVSNVWDTHAEDFSADPRLGFVGGVNVTIPLGKFLAIQPEVLYSQKGYRATGSVLGMNYELTHRADYLDIPLLLAIRPASFISILVGPQFSFHLYEKTTITSGEFSTAQSKQFENDNIRKNRLGAHLGLDFNLKHVVISPRFAVDFQDNKGDGTSTDPRYKNLYFQLTVGYRF